MAQLSRPFQIALLAVAVLAAAWFLLLHGHSTSTSGSSSSSAPARGAPASSQARASTAPTAASTAAPPGSEAGPQGLERAIAKAHAAVATSEQNAKQLQEKSAQASSTSTASSSSAAVSRPQAVTHAATKGGTAATHAAASRGSGRATTTPAVPARQAAVERELKRGDVVAVLFWNPKGADDVAVRTELQLLLAVHRRLGSVKGVPALRTLLKALGLELESKFAVQEASPSQVASFGSITRGVQVYQTPTILLVNPHGRTSTLTGLADAFSIEQAIDEAHHS
jgi:hypothetical protein